MWRPALDAVVGDKVEANDPDAANTMLMWRPRTSPELIMWSQRLLLPLRKLADDAESEANTASADV